MCSGHHETGDSSSKGKGAAEMDNDRKSRNTVSQNIILPVPAATDIMIKCISAQPRIESAEGAIKSKILRQLVR